ncbi:hypothetical protein BgiMline_007234, partial [Biomphalaria glabrata]
MDEFTTFHIVYFFPCHFRSEEGELGLPGCRGSASGVKFVPCQHEVPGSRRGNGMCRL